MDTKNRIEVKKLEIEPEKQGFIGWIKSKQVIRSVIGIAIGAIGGFLYLYFNNQGTMNTVPPGDIFQFVAVGAVFGFFVTNNPCARNKC